MEAVTEAVRSAAFVVPGALGVQEGGYLVVGAWLGLGPDVALAVSLVKRVREVVLGVPGLLAWQLQSVTAGDDAAGESPLQKGERTTDHTDRADARTHQDSSSPPREMGKGEGMKVPDPTPERLASRRPALALTDASRVGGGFQHTAKQLA
jgi:hypothetical protein